MSTKQQLLPVLRIFHNITQSLTQLTKTLVYSKTEIKTDYISYTLVVCCMAFLLPNQHHQSTEGLETEYIYNISDKTPGNIKEWKTTSGANATLSH